MSKKVSIVFHGAKRCLHTQQSFPAYGLIHYVGDYSNLRPSGKIITAIKEMTVRLMKI